MYSTSSSDSSDRERTAQNAFPGFVDIGCGNGLLVYILNAEGWRGWGFDARRRKTWATFPAIYTEKLKEMLLVPQILLLDSSTSSSNIKDTRTTTSPLLHAPATHNGIFPSSTFIISNHADELTSWTPLLAYLSSSPFIAIPCCSHDLGGTRFRAPVHKKYVTEDPNAGEKTKIKQPSAYAGLCSWVSHLTERVGYVVEKEHLRIPSTRNIAIVGRKMVVSGDDKDEDGRTKSVREVVEMEIGDAVSIEQVRLMWMRSGGELVKPSKGGH